MKTAKSCDQNYKVKFSSILLRKSEVKTPTIPPPDLKLIIDKYRYFDVLVEHKGDITIKSFLKKVLNYLKVPKEAKSSYYLALKDGSKPSSLAKVKKGTNLYLLKHFD